MGCIYSAMTPDNRMYVGQSVKPIYKRKWGHRAKSKRYAESAPDGGLYESINKFGWDNIRWGVIVECPNICLDNYETYYIRTKNTYHDGLNLTDKPSEYSFLGMKHTEETKSKMRKAKKNHFTKIQRLEVGRRFAKPIEYDGKRYTSISECSRKLGIGVSTIHYRLRNGKNGARYI